MQKKKVPVTNSQCWPVSH